MISDNWLCFILMGHLFVHFLCEFDLIKKRRHSIQSQCLFQGLMYYEEILGFF